MPKPLDERFWWKRTTTCMVFKYLPQLSIKFTVDISGLTTLAMWSSSASCTHSLTSQLPDLMEEVCTPLCRSGLSLIKQEQSREPRHGYLKTARLGSTKGSLSSTGGRQGTVASWWRLQRQQPKAMASNCGLHPGFRKPNSYWFSLKTKNILGKFDCGLYWSNVDF